MNSAPQVQTAEISDADLDNVSGGLSISANVSPTSVSSSELLAEVDSVKATPLGLVGGVLGALPTNVGVNGSL